jgi:diguanylate cyclase (GGDEF)-like protein
MVNRKNYWGIILFLLSILLAGLAFYIVLKFPSPSYKKLYQRVFPVSGICFAVISFFIGHFSYPRVHNLKVYLAGYLTGITTISYFLLFRIPQRNESAITGLFVLIFINLLVILLLPSYVKYRITKRITLSIAAVEGALVLLVRFYSPALFAWTKYIVRNELFHIPSICGFLWLGAIVAYSFYRLRDQFYLGGLFSGCALLYYLTWLTPIIFIEKYAVEAEKVFLVLVTLYLEIGIVIHWLSRMEHRISYDPLLQIYNRNYCSKIIEEQSNVKTAPPFGVAMVDIDRFKKVNDTYGHQAGDKVLYQVAQVILREVIPDGIACRYGGEEIIIFFPNKKTKKITPIIENVRAAIESMKVPTKRKKLSVTVSCGISCREVITQSIMDVIHTADKALYRAKKAGRNRIKTGKTSKPAVKKK